MEEAVGERVGVPLSEEPGEDVLDGVGVGLAVRVPVLVAGAVGEKWEEGESDRAALGEIVPSAVAAAVRVACAALAVGERMEEADLDAMPLGERVRIMEAVAEGSRVGVRMALRREEAEEDGEGRALGEVAKLSKCTHPCMPITLLVLGMVPTLERVGAAPMDRPKLGATKELPPPPAVGE